MKIDIFTHVYLPRYKAALYAYVDTHGINIRHEYAIQERRPTLTDMDARLRTLEEFPDVVQVVTVTMPPLEEIAPPKEATELARIANDEVAELVAAHPDRIVAAAAHLPMNDMDAALNEAERAIKELGMKGVQLHGTINGKPLSSEEFFPLYKMMHDFDLPIWIHPIRHSYDPDYASETTSANQIFSIFGWPYDTTVAMTRLIFGGIFEKFPGIKFITHHGGGMVPFYADRIISHYRNGLERFGQGKPFFPGLTKTPIEYFKMFYADTALNGGPLSLKVCLDFFGEDHLVFGSDAPYDVEHGSLSVRQTIQAIEDMGIGETAKKKIYEENARGLLHI
jgi:uncharacterized protein